MSAASRPPTSSEGHTLLELVMVLVLSGIIAGVVAPPLLQATLIRQGAIRRSALVQEASAALERMSREIREIPTRSDDPDAPDITSAAAGSIASPGVSFRAGSGTLEMMTRDDGQWRPLASHLKALELGYFDGEGNALTADPLGDGERDSVRRISIRLELQEGGESVFLRTGVFLRYFSFRSSVNGPARLPGRPHEPGDRPPGGDRDVPGAVRPGRHGGRGALGEPAGRLPVVRLRARLLCGRIGDGAGAAGAPGERGPRRRRLRGRDLQRPRRLRRPDIDGSTLRVDCAGGVFTATGAQGAARRRIEVVFQ